MPRLFFDLDGVHADFDTGIFQLTGKYPKDLREGDMWRAARNQPGFYANLPRMRGSVELWERYAKYNPPILTGCPSSFPEQAAADKRTWVAQTLGPQVPVITCASKDKRIHMEQPGDVLVDDWHKYRDLWIDHGGIFILHDPDNVQATIDELAKHGFV